MHQYAIAPAPGSPRITASEGNGTMWCVFRCTCICTTSGRKRTLNPINVPPAVLTGESHSAYLETPGRIIESGSAAFRDVPVCPVHVHHLLVCGRAERHGTSQNGSWLSPTLTEMRAFIPSLKIEMT